MQNCLIYPHGLQARRRVAACYNELLEDVGDVITPTVESDRDHVYHLYVIRTENRERLREHLSQSRHLHRFELSESAAILSRLRLSRPRSRRFSSRLLQPVPHSIACPSIQKCRKKRLQELASEIKNAFKLTPRTADEPSSSRAGSQPYLTQESTSSYYDFIGTRRRKSAETMQSNGCHCGVWARSASLCWRL